MKIKIKPLAAAVSLALMGVTITAMAQTPTQAPAPADKTEAEKNAARKANAQTADVIEVTGIRASLEKSIAVKKEAATNVEVVTAEDVGKMPDKTIAASTPMSSRAMAPTRQAMARDTLRQPAASLLPSAIASPTTSACISMATISTTRSAIPITSTRMPRPPSMKMAVSTLRRCG